MCDYVFHLAALPSFPRSIKDAPLSHRIPQPDKVTEFPEINAADLVSGDELVYAIPLPSVISARFLLIHS
jgi:hypothetical protein